MVAVAGAPPPRPPVGNLSITPEEQIRISGKRLLDQRWGIPDRGIEGDQPDHVEPGALGAVRHAGGHIGGEGPRLRVEDTDPPGPWVTTLHELRQRPQIVARRARHAHHVDASHAPRSRPRRRRGSKGSSRGPRRAGRPSRSTRSSMGRGADRLVLASGAARHSLARPLRYSRGRMRSTGARSSLPARRDSGLEFDRIETN
jgi:hypothetical protein